jgi:hypothetical protein
VSIFQTRIPQEITPQTAPPPGWGGAVEFGRQAVQDLLAPKIRLLVSQTERVVPPGPAHGSRPGPGSPEGRWQGYCPPASGRSAVVLTGRLPFSAAMRRRLSPCAWLLAKKARFS